MSPAYCQSLCDLFRYEYRGLTTIGRGSRNWFAGNARRMA